MQPVKCWFASLCVLLCAALPGIAVADSGTLAVAPTSATLTGSPTAYSAPSGTYTISVSDKKKGSATSWTLSCYVSSTTGPETSVALNFANVNSSIFGAVEVAGATPTIQLLGSAPGTSIFQGNDASGNNPAVAIATTGVSIVVPAYPKPGTYTGNLTFNLSISGTSPPPVSVTYSYTINQNGTITASPNSIPVTAFSATSSTTNTAPTSSSTVSIAAVTSSANSWSIQSAVTSHTGPETSVALNLAPVTQSVYPSTTFPNGATPSIQIGGSGAGTNVVQGSTTTTSQNSTTSVCTTGLIVTYPNTSAPGTYTGTIALTLTYNGYSSSSTLAYSYTIPTYLNVSVDQGLNFNINAPDMATGPSSGTGYPNAYCTISATGNVSFHLTGAVSSLTFASATIPTSQIWIAIDTSPSSANADAGTSANVNPSGSPTIRYPSVSTITASNVTLYLSGRVLTKLTNPPGTYSGTLTLTIVAG